MASYNQTLLTGQGMSFDDSQTAGKAYTAIHHEINRAIIEQTDKDDRHSKEIIESLKALREELKQAAIANRDTRIRDLPSGVRGQFTDVGKTIERLVREMPNKQDWQNFKNDLGQGFGSKLEERFGKNTVGGTAAQLAAGAVGSVFGVGGEAQFVIRAIQESTEAIREVSNGVKTVVRTSVEGTKKIIANFDTIGSFFDVDNPRGIAGKLVSGISGVFGGSDFATTIVKGVLGVVLSSTFIATLGSAVIAALGLSWLSDKYGRPTEGTNPKEDFDKRYGKGSLLSKFWLWNWEQLQRERESGIRGKNPREDPRKWIPETPPPPGPVSPLRRSSLDGGASPVSFADAGGMRLLSGGFGETQSQIHQDERLIQLLAMQEQEDIRNVGRPQLAAYHPSDSSLGDIGTGMSTSSGGQSVSSGGQHHSGIIPSIIGLLSSRRRHRAKRGLGKFNQGFPFKGFFRKGGLIPPGGVGVVGEDGAERVQATPSGAIVTPTLRSRLGGGRALTNATPVPIETPVPEGSIQESLRSLRRSSSPLRPFFHDPLPQTFEVTQSTIFYTGPKGNKSATYTDPETGESYTDRTPPVDVPASGMRSDTPGIAFGWHNFPKRGRETLGGYYLITPKGGENAGETFILPHSDTGPGAKGGEHKLDYNAPASKMVFGSMKESALQGGAFVRYIGETLPEGVFAGKQPSEGISEKFGLSPAHSEFIRQKLSVPLPRERPDDTPQTAGIPQGVVPIAGSKGQPGQLVPSSDLGKKLGVGDVGKGKPWPVVSTQKLLEKEARAGGFESAIRTMAPGGKYSEDPIDWAGNVKNADVSNFPLSENVEDRRGEHFKSQPRWLGEKHMREEAMKASGINIEKIRKEGEKHDLEVKGGGPKASDHQQDIHRLKNERDDAKRAANERRHQDRQQNSRQQNRPNVPVHRPQRVVGDFHLAMLTSGNPSG
jgi:hypothetical protein